MPSDGNSITLSGQPAPAGQTSTAVASKPAGAKPSPGSKAVTTAAAAAVTPATAVTAAMAVPKNTVQGVASASASGNAAFGVAPAAKAAPPPVTQPDLKSLVTQLNKHLNDSGRPDQFRVDPQSSTTIQEVNPATGAVIAQFSATEFPELARSAGAASGLLVDSLA